MSTVRYLRTQPATRPTVLDDDREPTEAELAEIEAEMPLIEAEIEVLNAEIAILAAVAGPTPLDWRRLRRAKRRVVRELTARYAHQSAETGTPAAARIARAA